MDKTVNYYEEKLKEIDAIKVKKELENSIKIKMLEADQKALVKSNGFLFAEIEEK